MILAGTIFRERKLVRDLSGKFWLCSLHFGHLAAYQTFVQYIWVLKILYFREIICLTIIFRERISQIIPKMRDFFPEHVRELLWLLRVIPLGFYYL